MRHWKKELSWWKVAVRKVDLNYILQAFSTGMEEVVPLCTNFRTFEMYETQREDSPNALNKSISMVNDAR
jgi:hypothetical protein